MAVDKLVDSVQLDSDLTSVANAIRQKGGTSSPLLFPGGFADAIAAIQSGAEYIKGTITIPNTGSSYTLEFGKTFGSYLFLLEMTEDSKTDVLNSGSTYTRTYAYIGVYPRRSINNVQSQSIIIDRYNPSSSASSYDAMSGNQLSASSMKFDVCGITESGAGSLVKGLTYNYYVVEIK